MYVRGSVCVRISFQRPDRVTWPKPDAYSLFIVYTIWCIRRKVGRGRDTTPWPNCTWEVLRNVCLSYNSIKDEYHQCIELSFFKNQSPRGGRQHLHKIITIVLFRKIISIIWVISYDMTGVFLATSNTQLCMEPLNSPKTLVHKQKIHWHICYYGWTNLVLYFDITIVFTYLTEPWYCTTTLTSYKWFMKTVLFRTIY